MLRMDFDSWQRHLTQVRPAIGAGNETKVDRWVAGFLSKYIAHFNKVFWKLAKENTDSVSLV